MINLEFIYLQNATWQTGPIAGIKTGNSFIQKPQIEIFFTNSS